MLNTVCSCYMRYGHVSTLERPMHRLRDDEVVHNAPVRVVVLGEFKRACVVRNHLAVPVSQALLPGGWDPLAIVTWTVLPEAVGARRPPIPGCDVHRASRMR